MLRSVEKDHGQLAKAGNETIEGSLFKWYYSKFRVYGCVSSVQLIRRQKMSSEQGTGASHDLSHARLRQADMK